MNNENTKGLKQSIKAGDISPDEAIAHVAKSSPYSESFVRWANTAGRRRYKQALENNKDQQPAVAKKETQEPTVAKKRTVKRKVTKVVEE